MILCAIMLTCSLSADLSKIRDKTEKLLYANKLKMNRCIDYTQLRFLHGKEISYCEILAAIEEIEKENGT